ENLAVAGTTDCPRLFHRRADFIPPNLTGRVSKAEAAMTVHSTDVPAGNAKQSMFDWDSGNILCLLNCFLNRAKGFIKLNDHTFPRSARFGDTVSSIA